MTGGWNFERDCFLADRLAALVPLVTPPSVHPSQAYSPRKTIYQRLRDHDRPLRVDVQGARVARQSGLVPCLARSQFQRLEFSRRSLGTFEPFRLDSEELDIVVSPVVHTTRPLPGHHLTDPQHGVMRLNQNYACSTVHAARLLYGNMQRPAWAWHMYKDMDMDMDMDMDPDPDTAIPDPCYSAHGL